MAGIQYKPVGVFWDIENCSVSKNRSPSDVIAHIRNFFVFNRLNHREYEFLISCDVTRLRKDMPDDINKAGGVTLAHVNGSSKNAADEKLRENMKKFVDTHASSVSPVLILISGDIDFVNDLRGYQMRLGCTIVLIHAPNCSQQFKIGWNEIYCFTDFCSAVRVNPSFEAASNAKFAAKKQIAVAPLSRPNQDGQPGSRNKSKDPRVQAQNIAERPQSSQPNQVPKDRNFRSQNSQPNDVQHPVGIFAPQSQGGQSGQGGRNKSTNQGSANQAQQPFKHPGGYTPSVTTNINGSQVNQQRAQQSSKNARGYIPSVGQAKAPPNGYQQRQAQQPFKNTGNYNLSVGQAKTPNGSQVNLHQAQQPFKNLGGYNPSVNQATTGINGMNMNDSTEKPAKPSKHILMVGGLPGKMDFKILKDNLQIQANRVHGKVKYVKNGQAFITFKDKTNADRAVELFNGREVFGKKLNVCFTKNIPFEDSANQKIKGGPDDFVMVKPADIGAVGGSKMQKNDKDHAGPNLHSSLAELGAILLGGMAARNSTGTKPVNKGQETCPIQ